MQYAVPQEEHIFQIFGLKAGFYFLDKHRSVLQVITKCKEILGSTGLYTLVSGGYWDRRKKIETEKIFVILGWDCANLSMLL